MILLDYKDRRPIYEQVVEKLKDLMICGVLEQDAQLPSVRALATDLSINPNTIQRLMRSWNEEVHLFRQRKRQLCGGYQFHSGA
uniref:GntR family transcriptional regulator n=1 Tax=Clostridium sp. NkU-1 TaxID=1095009 RepID=UPI000B0FD31C